MKSIIENEHHIRNCGFRIPAHAALAKLFSLPHENSDPILPLGHSPYSPGGDRCATRRMLTLQRR
jgi:hypothetical protein